VITEEIIIPVLQEHLSETLQCVDPTHQGWCCKCEHNITASPERHLAEHVLDPIVDEIEAYADRLAAAEHQLNVLMRGATLKSEERRLSGKIEGIQMARTYIAELMEGII
jgi:hypothetical protein